MCSWFYIGTHVQTCQCECVYECSQHMPDFIVIILSVFVFDQTCGSEEALQWIGGGGFFLACKDFFGERMAIHSLPALFFFFKVEISSCTRIPLFRLGSVHSCSVS